MKTPSHAPAVSLAPNPAGAGEKRIRIGFPVRFQSHHLSWTLRSPEDWLHGENRFVHSGDKGLVLDKTRSSKTRESRVLVKLDNGTFSWADSSLVEGLSHE